MTLEEWYAAVGDPDFQVRSGSSAHAGAHHACCLVTCVSSHRGEVTVTVCACGTQGLTFGLRWSRMGSCALHLLR